ncbi:MAG TPA: hypothetical protein VFU13_03310 [Steroidobacteraceae bacterium]|nr:hypothetical protein [Steroidobacteraceae bacterium]
MNARIALSAATVVNRRRGDFLRRITRTLGALLMVPVLGGYVHQAMAHAKEYNVVGVTESVELPGFTRESAKGLLAVNSKTAEFTLRLGTTTWNLAAACSNNVHKPRRCSRQFVRDAFESSEHIGGRFDQAPTGVLTFSVSDGTPTTFIGYRSPDNSFLVLTLERAGGTMLLFAVERGSGVASEPLAHALWGQYALHARTATFPRLLPSVGSSWDSYRSAMRNGSLVIGPGGFFGREASSAMTLRLHCSAAGAQCPWATGEHLSTLAEPRPFFGAWRAARSGEVVLMHRSVKTQDAWRGAATRDGDLLAMLEPGARSGADSLVLALRKPRDMSNASLQGTYNAVALEEFFDSDSGIRHARVLGPLDLDGGTTWAFTGTDAATKRSECASHDAGVCNAGVTGRTVAGGAGGTYHVSADGDVSLTGLAGDNTPREFIGNATADGSLIVMRRLGDGVACSFDCTGTQSFRSIIVAVRR